MHQIDDDVELARDLLSGKEEAFDRFLDRFRTKIFQYSYLMCGQREDAEEVSQETLLKVFEKLDQLKEPENIRAWVFRIAKNACLMKRRKSIFAPERELSLEELIPAGDGQGVERKLQLADWSALPETQALNSELRTVLEQAIGELPEIYRSVILLRDVEELTTEEAAQVLEVGTDVVKTRLHRARLAVRKKLDGYLQSARG
ncbi:MAG: sigma-70 family RNA polymerase sigma factor [Bryobacteraceae bacterium]|nr:sigma-70 family RNA polymerase sigma factor [Bryobacterales bacterium]MEB2361052.1 sigma-70 family RNA polymerase sigma factor [Bryobacterales bacterium]NUN01115.1 sigma-70 family RNA polymerase sigma factor [Bryobacteraceae bacterium]